MDPGVGGDYPVAEVPMSHAAVTFLPEPRELVSTWRRFGAFGPAYRIDAVERVLEDGDAVFRISIPSPVGDDEVTERRYSELLADPEEG